MNAEAVALAVDAYIAALTPEEFVGPILRVERHLDADTGVVTVQASRNGHPAHVTVNVSARRLADAWMGT